MALLSKSYMSTVSEIKQAMKKLPLGKRLALVKWAVKEANDNWDKQMTKDAASGKLDFLMREAQEAAAKGKLHAFPTP
jgi:hypothetical protein